VVRFLVDRKIQTSLGGLNMLFRRRLNIRTWSLALIIFLFAITLPFTIQADQVIEDDLIVRGSECLGLDCVNEQEFSFSTLLLKENNLRVFLHDTSNTASFPTNDWEIIANDSANGGASFLGFADRLPGYPYVSGAGYCDGGNNSGAQCGDSTLGGDSCAGVCVGGTAPADIPCSFGSSYCEDSFGGATCEGAGVCEAAGNIIFLMEAGAPANSLKIDSAGFVGLGTDAPAAELDVEGDAIVRGNLTVTGVIGGGTGTDQICPNKEVMIGLSADGTIICAGKNK
jgi:hypothetical protein